MRHPSPGELRSPTPGSLPGGRLSPGKRGEVYSAAEWTSCGYAADGLAA